MTAFWRSFRECLRLATSATYWVERLLAWLDERYLHDHAPVGGASPAPVYSVATGKPVDWELPRCRWCGESWPCPTWLAAADRVRERAGCTCQ